MLSKWILTIPLLVFSAPLLAQKTKPLVFDHNAEVIDAQYSADDKLIITLTANGIVKLWEPDKGIFVRSFSYAGTTPNYCAAFSPDGNVVAVINGRGGKVWNTKFGDVICSVFGFSDNIRSVHFSHNSKWLVAASMDGTAIVYNIETGEHHHSLNHMVESLGKAGAKNGLSDARFCHGDQAIITGSGEEIKNSRPNAADPLLLLNVAKTALYDSSVLVWDLKTGKIINKITGYPFDVSPDGSKIVTGSANVAGQTAKVWEASTGKVIHVLSGHTGEINACEFSHDGKWILTTSDEDGFIRLWEAHTGNLHSSLESPLNVARKARLNPHGNMIAIQSGDTTELLESSSGKVLYGLTSHRPPVFSHNGQQIVVFNGNNAAVYNALSGKPVLIEPDQKNKNVLKSVR